MAHASGPKRVKESSLDRDIQRLRDRMEKLKTFVMGDQSSTPIEEFDLATEELITDVFGSASPMIDAYEYAQLGEAGGLVNLTEEAPENITLDTNRDSLRQRQRVLESCVADLEARRAEMSKQTRPKTASGPRVMDFASKKILAVSMEATLKEAGQLLQENNIGSLLVRGGDEYVGSITETELAREVVAQGVDPATTTVKTCMREPLLSIESSEPIVEAVRLMKEKATRHLAVTESGKIVGVISVSDVLRYYSGVA